MIWYVTEYVVSDLFSHTRNLNYHRLIMLKQPIKNEQRSRNVEPQIVTQGKQNTQKTIKRISTQTATRDCAAKHRNKQFADKIKQCQNITKSPRHYLPMGRVELRR